jgi:hypothetical protein
MHKFLETKKLAIFIFNRIVTFNVLKKIESLLQFIQITK